MSVHNAVIFEALLCSCVITHELCACPTSVVHLVHPFSHSIVRRRCRRYAVQLIQSSMISYSSVYMINLHPSNSWFSANTLRRQALYRNLITFRDFIGLRKGIQCHEGHYMLSFVGCKSPDSRSQVNWLLSLIMVTGCRYGHFQISVWLFFILFFLQWRPILYQLLLSLQNKFYRISVEVGLYEFEWDEMNLTGFGFQV